VFNDDEVVDFDKTEATSAFFCHAFVYFYYMNIGFVKTESIIMQNFFRFPKIAFLGF